MCKRLIKSSTGLDNYKPKSALSVRTLPASGRRCAAPAETMLLFRRQGADGTRVFTVSSVLGLSKAQRCQAGPRPALCKEFSPQKFPAGSQRASRGRSQ
jgi:hypothetical protein